MLKLACILGILTTVAYAQSDQLSKERNLDMCGSETYRFDSASKECVYCAQGLKYNENLQCVGTPDILGKCYGDHHYHAATQECMFCASGYTFNETSRACEEKK